MKEWSTNPSTVDLHLEALRAIAEQLDRIATAMENPPEYEMPEQTISKEAREFADTASKIVKQEPKVIETPTPKKFKYSLMQGTAKEPILEPNYIIEANTFDEIKVLAKKLTEEKSWGTNWHAQPIK